MVKRVTLVCNDCGDTGITEPFITEMSETMGVSIERVHEMLYDGQIWLEGAHAIRTDQ